MNKREFEQLVSVRVTEGKTLLDQGLYQGAYYLVGYAVECALKAVIAKETKQYDFPDKAFAVRCFTHDLTDLVGVAGLKQRLKEREDADEEFKLNWAVVKDWSEHYRYETAIEKTKASDLYAAITDEPSGILQWLKAYW
ncbi:HEPN domain-containing protein [Janthinobacterium aquaticum]|uniref:HEPN domain-containing protein n=1 Tax=Janthinobacterium sp. FT58W TaxID=2654254 RepID=UPI0012652475|nr:HEPN domain-containing protein [Janthinobacterium sp. FT58W]KAB8041667.1 HEPN domain-containing protein [Janthinobacterium sp. FT58W]